MKKEKKPMSAGKILLIVFGSFLALILIIVAAFIYEYQHREQPINRLDNKLIDNIYERYGLQIPDSAELIWGENYRHMQDPTIFLFFTLPEEDFQNMLDNLSDDNWTTELPTRYGSFQPPDLGDWELNHVMAYNEQFNHLKYTDPVNGEVTVYFCGWRP